MSETTQQLNRNHHNAVTNVEQQGMILLSVNTRRRLINELVSLSYPFPSHNYEQYVAKALQAVSTVLPIDVLNAIRLFKNDKNAPSYIILDNLPIDYPVAFTPRSAKRSDIKKVTFVSEALLTGISALLGEPIGSFTEKEGSLVHDIIPKVNTSIPLSNQGSSVDFGLHVENAIMEKREHFVILFGQRQDRMKQAITPIACISKIMAKLDEQTISELYKKNFIIRKPYILDSSNLRKYSDPVAILSGAINYPDVRATLYPDGTKAITDLGAIALEKFRAAANEVAMKIKIKAGQMVMINNYRCLHGRTAFDAFGDGLDRYLLRAYVVDSLWDLRDYQTRSLRIIDR